MTSPPTYPLAGGVYFEHPDGRLERIDEPSEPRTEAPSMRTDGPPPASPRRRSTTQIRIGTGSHDQE